MAKQHPLIEIALTGGLWLYDNESMWRFHNMPQEYVYDWNTFIDMCQEEHHNKWTDSLLTAIKNGLCPQIANNPYNITKKGMYATDSRYGVDWDVRKVWYFIAGKEFSATTVPSFLIHPPDYIVGVQNQFSRTPHMYTTKIGTPRWDWPYGLMRIRKKDQQCAYVFDHVTKAWKFLLNWLFV